MISPDSDGHRDTDEPVLFRTWGRMYWLLVVVLVSIIILLYVVERVYQ